jgi:hypothetical protein
MDEWNIRVLSPNVDPSQMCKSALKTLKREDYNPENHLGIWKQIENFFFEKILLDRENMPPEVTEKTNVSPL